MTTREVVLAAVMVALAAASFLVGCDDLPSPPVVQTRMTLTDVGPNPMEVHIEDRAVTCWTTGHGGISCLPDSQVRR